MKKSIAKKIYLLLGIVLIIGISYALYLFFMPHRDVQATKAFLEISATQLVEETLTNPEAANNKYLEESGDSKVIIIEGIVSDIYEDQKKQKVVILKSNKSKIGVSCTFMLSSNHQTTDLKNGNKVKIKGVFRSGAEIDDDLGLTEDVIIENCAII